MPLAINGLYRFDEFELDSGRRALARHGQRVALSPKAFDVLAYLVANPGRLVTKEEIMKAVWPDSFVEESNLAQHISGLRKALADKSELIVTVPGRGYQFAAPVEQPRLETNGAAAESGDVILERVRERAHIVIEETETAAKPQAIEARRHSPIFRWLPWAITAAVVLTAAGYLTWRQFGPQPQLRKVVVGDFLNLTGDSSMDTTLKSALTIGLNQTPYIQLMSGGLVSTTLASMQKTPDTPLLGQTALEVCKRASFQVLLLGRVETAKSEYNLGLEARNCVTGKVLAEFKGNAVNKDATLDALDDLSRRVRVKLGEPNASLDQFNVPLYNATTFSFEALEDYNAGTKLGNAGKLKEAIEAFQKAVQIDPKFAMAQAGLGTAYYNMNAFDTAAPYYKKAFELSANVSQPEKFYIRSNYYLIGLGDIVDGAKTFEDWTGVYPQNETPWIGLANAEIELGNFSRAIEAGEHALKYGLDRPAIAYELLARAYMRANRFADAKRTIAEAQAQGRDDANLHYIAFEMAAIEHDPETLHRESAWTRSNPDTYSNLEAEAIVLADEGRVRQFEEMMEETMVQAVRAGNPEYADGMLIDEAGIESELGRNAKALELLRRVKDRTSSDFAVKSVRAGDLATGEVRLRQKEEGTSDTNEHFLLLPELRALVALNRHDPTGAIAALDPSRPYELARCEVIEARGEAYLVAGQAENAAAEYQKLIANPALEDPMLPRTILAHLGLARAYTMEKKTAESRAEYEKLFTLWADADPALPVLEQARSEYAKLR